MDDAKTELTRVRHTLLWVREKRQDPTQSTVVYKLCDELITLLVLRLQVLTGEDRSHAP